MVDNNTTQSESYSSDFEWPNAKQFGEYIKLKFKSFESVDNYIFHGEVFADPAFKRKAYYFFIEAAGYFYANLFSGHYSVEMTTSHFYIISQKNRNTNAQRYIPEKATVLYESYEDCKNYFSSIHENIGEKIIINITELFKIFLVEQNLLVPDFLKNQSESKRLLIGVNSNLSEFNPTLI